MARDRQRAFRFGLSAEARAAWWLRLKGWRILERRFTGAGCEIDLIARRAGVIAFIEVKARPSLAEAGLSLTPAKMRRIDRAARSWLARHPPKPGMTCRIDAVLVAPGLVPRHTVNIAPLGES